MPREFISSGFTLVSKDALNAPQLVLKSKEGSVFELHVLDHDIVRFRHIPPSTSSASTGLGLGLVGGQIPQLSTHSIHPSYSNNNNTLPFSSSNHLTKSPSDQPNPSSSEFSKSRKLSLKSPLSPIPPSLHFQPPSVTPTSGVARSEVSRLFPCTPPEIEELPQGSGFIVSTDKIQVTINIDDGQGGLYLTWASHAVPDKPFLQDLKYRAYPLFHSSLGARHFISRFINAFKKVKTNT
jgi:hypothetical protein